MKLLLSFQFSCSVVSDSLWPHELQYARPPCPSPTPRVHSDSRPSSQWCHPAISSSVVPFSSCPQSLPASEAFPMSQLFTWGGQSTRVSASASVLPMNIQDWCWSWNSNTLATWCEELTRWKRPWCWERLKVGGEEDDWGWDGWMASLIRGTGVSSNHGRSWRRGNPDVLQFMGSQRVASEQQKLLLGLHFTNYGK